MMVRLKPDPTTTTALVFGRGLGPERGEQLADALPAQHLSFPVDLKSGSIAIPS